MLENLQMIDRKIVFEIHRRKDMGHSARQTALDLKIGRSTVRKYLENPEKVTVLRKPKASKLDPFREKIKELLQFFPGMSAARINEKIRKTGYDGSITILGNYLRTLQSDPKTSISNQILTGIDAHVFWSYAARIGDRTSYCFIMVLSFSKMFYIEFFPSRSLESLLTGHLHAFHYFQGIPQKVYYNLKNVVLNIPGSNTQFNRKFLDFVTCHLFTPQVYNVRNLQEIGRFENDAYYIRNNFLAGRAFNSFIDINQQAILWIDTVANVRFRRTVKARVIDLFKEKEQPYMIPLPKTGKESQKSKTFPL